MFHQPPGMILAPVLLLSCAGVHRGLWRRVRTRSGLFDVVSEFLTVGVPRAGVRIVHAVQNGPSRHRKQRCAVKP